MHLCPPPVRSGRGVVLYVRGQRQSGQGAHPGPQPQRPIAGGPWPRLPAGAGGPPDWLGGGGRGHGALPMLLSGFRLPRRRRRLLRRGREEVPWVGYRSNYTCGCYWGFFRFGWLVGCLVGWLVGCLVAWLVGCLVACLVACFVAWLLGCLVGCLFGLSVSEFTKFVTSFHLFA